MKKKQPLLYIYIYNERVSLSLLRAAQVTLTGLYTYNKVFKQYPIEVRNVSPSLLRAAQCQNEVHLALKTCCSHKHCSQNDNKVVKGIHYLSELISGSEIAYVRKRTRLCRRVDKL